MGVENAVLCSHGPSSILWSENGPSCGTVACFVGGKEGGFGSVCLKLYQFEIITRLCLSTMETILK